MWYSSSESKWVLIYLCIQVFIKFILLFIKFLFTLFMMENCAVMENCAFHDDKTTILTLITAQGKEHAQLIT